MSNLRELKKVVNEARFRERDIAKALDIMVELSFEGIRISRIGKDGVIEFQSDRSDSKIAGANLKVVAQKILDDLQKIL